MFIKGDGVSGVAPAAGNSGSNFSERFSKAFGDAGEAMANPYQNTPATAPLIYPDGVNSVGSSQPDASLDWSGYDQAQWEYERQLELLAEQRAYNSAEAQKNRDWQERMSNTAYQRAVQDLEAAGLNKWLAVTGGNGASASTPSGSSATSSAGDASAPNPAIYKSMLQFAASIITGASRLIGSMIG